MGYTGPYALEIKETLYRVHIDEIFSYHSQIENVRLVRLWYKLCGNRSTPDKIFEKVLFQRLYPHIRNRIIPQPSLNSPIYNWNSR